MNWPDESCWTLLTFCRKHPYIFSEYETLIFWEPYSKGTGTKHSALCTPKVTIPAMQLERLRAHVFGSQVACSWDGLCFLGSG